MMWYIFKVYRADRNWTKKRIFAGSIEEAACRVDEWCEMNGYSDWALEGASWA